MRRANFHERLVELRGNLTGAADQKREQELGIAKLRGLRQWRHIGSEEIAGLTQPSAVPFDHVMEMFLRMRPRFVVGASDESEVKLCSGEIFRIAPRLLQRGIVDLLGARIGE